MKRLSIFGLLNVVAFMCSSQPVKSTLVASVSGVDRMSLVKSSIDIPAWHEKSFWPLYEDYLKELSEASSSSYRAQESLAKNDKTLTDQEAFEFGVQMIGSRLDELQIRKRHYLEIGGVVNGIIAFQFLQTEALMDMMESSSMYEQSSLKNFRFHPRAIKFDQIKTAKHNTIAAALGLKDQEATAFWNIYTKYEEECDAILGEDYSMFSLYAGEPSDFTPAIAKRLGHDLLNVMERELKLKEKYFMQMKGAVGSHLAAGFLAWEDYYSVVSKMYAFADN